MALEYTRLYLPTSSYEEKECGIKVIDFEEEELQNMPSIFDEVKILGKSL